MADANGHRFWLLAGAEDFDLSAGELAWTEGARCLHLAGRPDAFEGGASRNAALDMADLPPVAVDAFGSWAGAETAEGGRRIIVAAGAGEGVVPVLDLSLGTVLHDLCVDAEGVLRMAVRDENGQGRILLADMRGRWQVPVSLPTGAAEPDRLAAAGGMVWVLERASGRLWVETGAPLHDLAVRSYAGHIFRPRPEYPTPPGLHELPPVEIAANERIACMAARPDGLLAVLVLGSVQSRRVRVVFVGEGGGRVSLEVPVLGFPGAVGWVTAGRMALLYPGVSRAAVFETGEGVPEALTLSPLRYPLKGSGPLRLARGGILPCRYVRHEGPHPALPRPLEPLSQATYRGQGTAAAARPVDAGAAGTVWHRVVVEGDFPPGTGAVIELRAADTIEGLAEAAPAPHLFGVAQGLAEAPRGAWLADATELPFARGLLGAAPVIDRTGSFSALIQCSDRASRELVGRYLGVTISLLGSGQASPRIAGVRLWGRRFSLVRRYLPRVFHAPDGAEARDAVGPAQPKDFLDRHVAMFEGVLTRLEDKAASAHLVTDAWAAPAEALDWLSGWIGAELAPALDETARRRMLANAVRLHRRRGTLPGLMLALDIVTGGEVASGGIVAFEDHRLRRVFSTILGADLGRRNDPLLGGPVESGNSFVGPTLVLGDADEFDGGTQRLSAAQETELAALFEAPDRRANGEAVRGFFAALANRVTVLVHADADDTRLALIRETARALTPAHVALRVEPASRPLILGLYALVGIDTYLRPRPEPSQVRLDRSKLGERDHVLRLPSLDPRFERGERT